MSLISGKINAPGTIQHSDGPDTLEFGEITGGNSQRSKWIEQVLAVKGFKATACPNIEERMWWKLVAYAGVGVFCVARGDKGVIWGTSETKALYRQAIAEAVTIAQAKNIPLKNLIPDEHIALARIAFPP